MKKNLLEQLTTSTLFMHYLNGWRWFFLASGLLCWVCCPAVALRSDTTQAADFVADSVLFNNINHTTLYSGHVKMDQGTTQLTADQVTLYRDKKGVMTQAIATGQPAHYTTLPDKQQKPLHAYGDRIEYYPIQQIVIIVGHGQVNQAVNSLNGPRIIYDMVKQTLTSLPEVGIANQKPLIIFQPQSLLGSAIQPGSS